LKCAFSYANQHHDREKLNAMAVLRLLTNPFDGLNERGASNAVEETGLHDSRVMLLFGELQRSRAHDRRSARSLGGQRSVYGCRPGLLG
jgi:hypothetical protein